MELEWQLRYGMELGLERKRELRLRVGLGRVGVEYGLMIVELKLGLGESGLELWLLRVGVGTRFRES